MKTHWWTSKGGMKWDTWLPAFSVACTLTVTALTVDTMRDDTETSSLDDVHWWRQTRLAVEVRCLLVRGRAGRLRTHDLSSVHERERRDRGQAADANGDRRRGTSPLVDAVAGVLDIGAQCCGSDCGRGGGRRRSGRGWDWSWGGRLSRGAQRHNCRLGSCWCSRRWDLRRRSRD